MKHAVVLAALVLATGSASAASPAVSVSDCWIRSVPAPAPSAGYFKVHNAGKTPVRLVAASSSAYGEVMLHQTRHDGGMSKMSMVPSVEIAAGGSLEFKPGGFHAMLEKPRQEIKVGAVVPVQFEFDSGEKVQASCEVKPAKTMAH